MRGQEYVGEDAADDGAPRYVVRRGCAERALGLRGASVQVRLDVGDRVGAVRVLEALEELRSRVQRVLLGADLLHDVHREQAAELGGALEAEVPGERGEEAGPERVADAGRLDLADLGDRGDGDRLLALAVDADALGAQRDDPGADAARHLVGGPAGLLGDQLGFVLVGEQDRRAPSMRSRIMSPSPNASCWDGSATKR